MRSPIMILHIDDLNKSLDYYINILNMKLLSRKDFPKNRLTLAFLEHSNPLDPTLLELSYRWT